MSSNSAKRLKFSKPPVVEVVFGVLFQTNKPIEAVHMGLFWSLVREEFPYTEEVAPLTPIVEPKTLQKQTIEFEVVDKPPLPRLWMHSKDHRTLIQLQEDRILYNWKKNDNEAVYTSYDDVYPKFEEKLELFRNFLKSEGFEEPVYRQFELTYIDHISSNNGLKIVGEGGVLVDHVRDQSPHRFLPEPESYAWKTTYPLPNNLGRFHITAQTVLSLATQERIMRLEYTARGVSADSSEEGRKTWFEVAHNWSYNSFLDTISPDLQKMWEPIQ